METPLSQREFDRWREDDAQFKTIVLKHIEMQTNLNLESQGRMSTLEANHKEMSDTVNRRVTWMSAIVAAIIGGLVAIVGLFVKGS